MKRKSNPDETRDRIIRAAGEVFGHYGFDGTTIRQITKRADVNVAAVNYHFHDKAELYLRVLREAKCLAGELAAIDLPGGPEDRLRAFILTFVRGLLDPQRPSWHVQVITQEMMRPTPALDTLVREMTEPIYRQLRGLISDAAAPMPRARLDLLTFSVLGQCLFYVRSRPMIERIAPALSRGPDRVERIAGHITTFSLAALCHLEKNSNKRFTARSGQTSKRGRLPALFAS